MTSGSEFTVKEIVIELRNDVNRLIEKIDRIDRQGSIGTKQELEDHENRIRSVEKDRWIAKGALALVVVLLPVVSTLVYSAFT